MNGTFSFAALIYIFIKLTRLLTKNLFIGEFNLIFSFRNVEAADLKNWRTIRL